MKMTIKEKEPHLFRQKKSDSEKNEEKFPFCLQEKEMEKLLDDLPPFTFNSIVKRVRNSGKNIQNSSVV